MHLDKLKKRKKSHFDLKIAQKHQNYVFKTSFVIFTMVFPKTIISIIVENLQSKLQSKCHFVIIQMQLPPLSCKKAKNFLKTLIFCSI